MNAADFDPSDYERPAVKGRVQLAPRVAVYVRFTREPCDEWPNALWRGTAVLEAPGRNGTYNNTAQTLRESSADVSSWIAKRLAEVAP